MSRYSASGRAWRRLRSSVLAMTTTCWICGKAGADSVDHVVPASVAPQRRMDPTNLRAAHLSCNSRRGAARATQTPLTPSREW